LNAAIAILEETVTHDRRVGIMPNHSLTLVSLGNAYAMAGRLDEAAAQAEQAFAIARTRKKAGYEAYALRLVGEIATRREPSRVEEASDAYRRALGLANEQGMRPLVAHCHQGLGKLYWRVGKREQAEEHLTTAMTMYREIDMRFWLEKAEKEMKQS